MDTICAECSKPYVYVRARGHTKTTCNSCMANRYKEVKKLKYLEYKGGKCIRCGYNACIQALCFHHVDPSTKSFGISGSHGRSWDIMKAELDKCILLCQNCHHEYHAGFWSL